MRCENILVIGEVRGTINLYKSVSNDLIHYGVKGMKWGIRKDRITVSKQMKLSDETIKRSKTANLDKWGKTKDTNILYITGYSGSGKSTVARKLADDNTNIIHLDSFFEKLDSNVIASIKDKEFITYLNKNFPDYNNIVTSKSRHSKDWWNDVDTLMSNTEKFAQEQFTKNKRVIVEGVQLSDQTVYPDKTFFKDKPIMILQTNAKTSMNRAWERDDKIGEISKESMDEYIKWYGNMHESLDKLSLVVNAKRGQDWVTNYLNDRRVKQYEN